MKKWLKGKTKKTGEPHKSTLEKVKKILAFFKFFSRVMIVAMVLFLALLGFFVFEIAGAKEAIFAMSPEQKFKTLRTLWTISSIFAYEISVYKNVANKLIVGASGVGLIASFWLYTQLIDKMQHAIDLENIMTSPFAIPFCVFAISEIALFLLNHFTPGEWWIEMPGGVMRKFAGKNKRDAYEKAEKYIEKA